MAKYIPIGEPTNRSEAESLRALRDQLPEHYVVVGNFDLRLPNRANTLEFDAVVIAEHRIFAVEIKGWSGEIRGDARRWYLDWGHVQNPFILTERKAKALRGFLSQTVADFPQSVSCEAVVLLPASAEIKMVDGTADHIVMLNGLYDFFVDEDYIREHGPGPLLDPDLRDRIERALLPLATPASQTPRIADYEILAEFEREDETQPYREFVGRHRLVRSRSRVRIKRYSLDPLASPAEQEQQFERALRDFEALTRLDSNPYIADGYEVIRDQDDELNFYVVSEWGGSRTLRDHIRDWSADQQGRDFGAPFAAHLLRAVQFMHDRGIIHRNLHPGVIYLTEEGDVPFKIADFDFARVVQLPSIEGSFDRMGTEGYAAPELWRQNNYDHRVDHFSVGAILFELITHTRLYQSLADMLYHDKTWARRREEVPAEALAVLDPLLQSDPARRPESLHELIRIVEAR